MLSRQLQTMPKKKNDLSEIDDPDFVPDRIDIKKDKAASGDLGEDEHADEKYGLSDKEASDKADEDVTRVEQELRKIKEPDIEELKARLERAKILAAQMNAKKSKSIK